MRKAILSLAVLFAVAAVVSALPTGPGGTLYFGGKDNYPTHGTKLFRINLDSAWNTVDDDGNIMTTGACTNFATLNAVMADVNGTAFGSPEIGWNEYGNMDMNGLYHNATILIGAYDNTTPAAGSTGGTQGADILSVDARTAAVTIVNDGFNSNDARDTYNFAGLCPVDSGFTPGGEAKGIHVLASGTSVWLDTDGDGVFEDSPVACSHTDREMEYVSITSGYSVDGLGVVTGAMIAHTYARTMAVYKSATGYTTITTMDTDLAANCGVGSLDGIAAGDTTGNGVPDVYWSHGGDNLVHGTDKNGDGDWADDNEAWLMGNADIAGSAQGPHDMELIQCPDNKWVLLWWGHHNKWSSNNSISVYAFELDSNGDAIDAGTVIASYNMDQGTGDASMLDLNTYGNEMEFAPLGEAVPEPATMMLVGTGVLSLVGIIRRRRLN